MKAGTRWGAAGGLWLLVASECMAALYSRTETIEYHDDTRLWVLGQVSRRVVNGLEAERTAYNTLALPEHQYAFGAKVSTTGYNLDGTVQTVMDGNGRLTRFEQYKRDIPQRITFADGTQQTAGVDDHGWLSWVSDENGSRTCYAYDTMGRVTLRVYPSESTAQLCDDTAWNPAGQAFEPVPMAEYGLAAGHWRQTASTGTRQKTTYFDALWRPVLTREWDTGDAVTQRYTRIAYDAHGRATFASQPSSDANATVGIWTEYDALGRPTSQTQDSELGPLTTRSEYLPGFRTRVIQPRGQATVTMYQAFDTPTYEFPVGIEHPEGAATEIYRDVFGKVVALRRRGAAGEDVWRRYVYQADQRLCKTLEPETGATVFGYDGAGNLSWSASGLSGLTDAQDCNQTHAWASERVVHRTYDARNQLHELRFPDGVGNQRWYYTLNGLPNEVTVWNEANGAPVVNAYTYRRRGLLAGESVQQPLWYGWSLGYGYDRNGALSAQVYPTGLAVNYYPNALGQPTQVRDQHGQVYASGVQYHPNGAVKQFTYGNGRVHTMAQNSRQLPARHADSGGVLDHAYEYDRNGNVQYLFDQVNPDLHRYLYYDGLDRLTSAGSQMFGGDHWHRFTYDALDNLTSWTLGGVKDYAAYQYDGANRLTSIRNSAGATVMGLSYDAQGNLANRNGQPYRFDYGNRLREVVGQESYRYDGHGRRVMAHAGSGDILSMYNQSGQLLHVGDFRRGMGEENLYLGGRLLAIRETAIATGARRILYQHTDGLGSPVAVTDAAGHVVSRSYHEPFGKVIGQPTYGGIGYTGHVQDAATGLTYMQQRYMSSDVGVFLSVDPVTAYSKPGVNFNRYWYANNNPYKYTDPDGRWICSDGGSGSCSTFRSALTLVKQASHSERLSQAERNVLADSISFYGEEGHAGVKISFADLRGSSGNATDKTATFDMNPHRRESESKTLSSLAKTVAHEGDHGFRQANGSSKGMTRLALERRGYEAQAYFQKAAGFMDWPGANGWTSWGGLDASAIEGQATLSVYKACGTLTGCDGK